MLRQCRYLAAAAAVTVGLLGPGLGSASAASTTSPAWRSWGGEFNSAPDAMTFFWNGPGQWVFVRGGGNHIYLRRGDSGVASGPWRLRFPASYATSGPTVAFDPSPDFGATVGVRGRDNALWVSGTLIQENSANLIWTNWGSLGGVLTSDPDAAYMPPRPHNFSGQLYVFARGLDDSIMYTTGSGAWPSLGGHVSSAPGVAHARIGGLDRLYIFARGFDNALYYRTLRSGWQSLGGVLASAPDASFDGDRLVVAVLGPDHAVHYRTLPAAGGNWTSWHSLGGWGAYGVSLTSYSPSNYTNGTGPTGPGRTFVFTIGSDTALWSAQVCDPIRCY